MIQRGRKTATALASVTSMGQRPRLSPPKTLTTEQRKVWRETVDNRPSDWFGPEQRSLLEQYCRHVVHARCIGKALETLTAEGLLDPHQLEHHTKLLTIHMRETKSATLHAVQLRLTNQSRMDKLAAGRESRQYAASTGAQPWEE